MTHPRFNGRAERIRAYWSAHPKGCTLRALIVAIEPGCKANNMRSSVNTLVLQGKGSTQQINGVAHFLPTATTFIDGRVAANAMHAGRPHPKRTKPAPAPASIAIPKRTRTPLRGLDSRLTTHIDARSARRENLAADVAAFLAGGGVIQHFAHGESAASIAEQQQRFHEHRQRGSGQKIAARAQRNEWEE